MSLMGVIMVSDLIRREDAILAAMKSRDLGELWDRLENIEPVDAVEVVRCDTCEYYHPCDIHDGEIGRCLIKINRNFMECNGYCSLGARKDGGEEDA